MARLTKAARRWPAQPAHSQDLRALAGYGARELAAMPPGTVLNLADGRQAVRYDWGWAARPAPQLFEVWEGAAQC